MYCSALKDVVATSPRYEELSGTDHPVGGHWELAIITIDNSVGNEKGLATAVSVSLLRNGFIFVTSTVQTCGRDAVKICATQTLAEMDQAINK
jgi:hypothetical protein